MPGRDRFVNPATGTTYWWTTSHEDESEAGKSRSIVTTASTAATGKTYHQGAEDPFVMKWTGRIDHRSQLYEMWAWYELCRHQTIYLYDFDGQGYDVQIQSFRPKRRRKLSYTGRDPSVPHHFWEYEIEFLVYGFLVGDMANAGVAP